MTDPMRVSISDLKIFDQQLRPAAHRSGAIPCRSLPAPLALAGQGGTSCRSATFDNRGIIQVSRDLHRGMGNLQHEGAPVVIIKPVEAVSQLIDALDEIRFHDDRTPGIDRRKLLGNVDLVHHHEDARVGLG